MKLNKIGVISTNVQQAILQRMWNVFNASFSVQCL